MKINKFLLVGASIIALGCSMNDPSYAGWAKSSSSSASRSMSYSRSYSSSFSTSSWGRSQVNQSSKFSGFGSKPSSSGSSRISAPSSLSNTRPSSSSIMTSKSNSIDSGKAYDRSQYNRPSNASSNSQAASSFSWGGSRTTASQSSTSSYPTSKTVTKKYVTKNYYYTSPSGYHYHYDVPSYYHPYHPMYGAWNGFFLGMLLSNAMQPSYYNWAYSHYNDPGYIAWHQDMVQQAQNNQELRDQLSVLDNKVDDLRRQNSPQTNTIPDGVTDDEIKSNVTPVEQPAPTPAPENTKSNTGSNVFLGVSALAVIGILSFIVFKIL